MAVTITFYYDQPLSDVVGQSYCRDNRTGKKTLRHADIIKPIPANVATTRYFRNTASDITGYLKLDTTAGTTKKNIAVSAELFEILIDEWATPVLAVEGFFYNTDNLCSVVAKYAGTPNFGRTPTLRIKIYKRNNGTETFLSTRDINLTTSESQYDWTLPNFTLATTDRYVIKLYGIQTLSG